MMKERSWVFVREAGTVILVCTIVLWGLLSFPRAPEATGPDAPTTTAAAAESENRVAARQLENSYAGRLGKAIEPALAPLGFDWKIGVGIIGAFAAREVFVSTLGLVYGIGEVDDEAIPLRERLRSEQSASGQPKYTALTGLSLLVFFALACQCMSTLAVVRRETRTWRWPLFMFAYMTALAWGMSFLVYQIGSWLGA
jgi:ferrous iron transport protein B